MQQDRPRVKKPQEPYTGEKLVSETLSSLGAFVREGSDEAYAAYSKGYSRLDELARLNNDQVGMEARRIVNDLDAYERWAVSQDDADRPTRLVRSGGFFSDGQPRLLERATAERSWWTGSGPTDAYPVSDSLANYLPEADEPQQRYLRAMLHYESGSAFENVTWDPEEETFHVEHPDVPAGVTLPWKSMWEMWPRVRGSMLGRPGDTMGVPGAAALAQGASVATTVFEKGVHGIIEGIIGDKPPPSTGPTARPGSNIHYFPMGPDGSWVGGWFENERMQDPTYTRAYEMVAQLLEANTLAQDGDENAAELIRSFEEATGIDVPEDATLQQGVLEHFAQGVGVVFDIGASAKVLRGLAAAGKAGAAALNVGKGVRAAKAIEIISGFKGTIEPAAKAAKVGGRYSVPWFLRGTVSMMTDLTAYDVARSGLGIPGSQDNALEAAKDGALEGLAIGAFNTLFKAARTSVGMMLTSKTLGKGLEKIAQVEVKGAKAAPVVLGKAAAAPIRALRTRLVAAERAATQFTGTGIPSVDWLVEMLPAQLRHGRTVAEGLYRLQGAAGRAAAFGQVIDSYALGTALGAYQDAVNDPQWARMDGWRKMWRFLEGFTSAEAVGNGVAFSTAAGMGLARWRWSPEKELANFPADQRAGVEGLLRHVAERISSPTPREAEHFLDLFGRIEKAEPGFFKGLEFRDPADAAEQMRWQESPFVSVKQARDILAANRADPRYEGETPWGIVRDVVENGGAFNEAERVAIGQDVAQTPEVRIKKTTPREEVILQPDQPDQPPPGEGWKRSKLPDGRVAYRRGGEERIVARPKLDPKLYATRTWSSWIYDVTGFLKTSDELPLGSQYAQDITTAKVHSLAREEPAMRERMIAKLGEGTYNEAVASARRAIEGAQDAARTLAEGTGYQRAVEAMLEYARIGGEGKPVPADLLARMKAEKLVDEDGVLNPRARSTMADWLDAHVDVQRSKYGGEEDAQALLRLNGGLAFGDSRWGSLGVDSTVRKLGKMQTWAPYVRKVVPNFLYKHLLARVFTWTPFSQNLRTAIERDTLRHWVERTKEPRDWKRVSAMMKAQAALQDLAALFGGHNIPRAHQELLRWSIESGAFRKMKGPESFEKIQPGTGYLFGFAHQSTEILAAIGRRGVLEGWLDVDQARKHFKRYIAYLPIDKEIEGRYISELREGQIPIPFAGRNIQRAGTARGQIATRLDDPFYHLRRTVAQEAQQIEFLGTLSDTLHGGWAIGEAEFNSMPKWIRAEYDPVTTDPADGKAGIFWKWDRGPSNRLHVILSNLEAQYEAGQAAGRRPFTSKMRSLIDDYMGRGERGQLYLPRGLMQELDVMFGNTFNPPNPKAGPLGAAVEAWEQGWRFVRRGLTINSPKHWAKNIGNSIGTNHLLDIVPMSDAVQLVTTGTGYYADAFRSMADYLRVSGGRPLRGTEKPADIPIEQWDRMMLVERAAEQLGGATWAGGGIQTESIVDVLSSVANADRVSENLRRQLMEQGSSSLEQIEATVLDVTRRMSGGIEGLDRRLMHLLSRRNPTEGAEALATNTAQYQSVELAFKLAGAMRVLDVNPNISFRRALSLAAAGTANYNDTNVFARQVNTSRGLFHNPLWQATDASTRRAVGATMRSILKGQFWMYQNTMMVPKLKAVLAHPVKAAAVAAVTASAARLFTYLGTKDEEAIKDELGYKLELYGSLNQATPPEVLPRATREAFARAHPTTWLPDITGSLTTIGNEVRGLIHKVISGDIFMFEAASRGDKTMVSTLEDFAPGWGDVAQIERALAETQQQMRTDPAFLATSWLGMRFATGSSLVAHGIVDAFRGDKPMREKALLATKEATRLLPVLHGTSPLSLQALKFAEITGADGQGLGDWLRGIRASRLQDPLEQWSDVALSTLWTSRQILQPAPLRAEVGVGDAFLRKLFPDWNETPLEDQKRLRDARRMVDAQIAQTMTDAYAEYNGWANGTFTYGGLLVNRLAEVDQFVKDLPPELRESGEMLWSRYIQSSEWAELATTMEAIAEQRVVRPSYFEEMTRRAMRDPYGKNLQEWIYQQVVEKQVPTSELGDFAIMFHYALKPPEDMTAPSASDWVKVWDRLTEAGYDPINKPVDHIDAIRAFQRKRAKAEMQGGLDFLRAFTAVQEQEVQ